ncbi:hypothetical protein ACHQM5_014423 [Ranunculus cassubicifolius]
MVVYTGKTLWPELLGVDGLTAAATIEREDPRLRTVLLREHRHVRIHNYSCFRVRIWVDKNGIVERVPSVG